MEPQIFRNSHQTYLHFANQSPFITLLPIFYFILFIYLFFFGGGGGGVKIVVASFPIFRLLSPFSINAVIDHVTMR